MSENAVMEYAEVGKKMPCLLVFYHHFSYFRVKHLQEILFFYAGEISDEAHTGNLESGINYLHIKKYLQSKLYFFDSEFIRI